MMTPIGGQWIADGNGDDPAALADGIGAPLLVRDAPIEESPDVGLPPGAHGASGAEALPDWASALTPRRVASGAVVIVAVGFLFALVIRFYLVLFLFLIALIVATVTRPGVEWLARRGVRREIGVILMYLGLFVLVALFLALVVPLLAGQVDAVTERLPVLYSDLCGTLLNAGNRTVERIARGLPRDLPAFGGAPAGAEPSGTAITAGWPMLRSAGSALFLVGAILALAFYWVVEGDVITRRVLLFVRQDRREQVRTIWSEMEATIGGFFRGQMILMGIIAGLSGLGYVIIGLPYALGLALIAGVCEVIPMVGPTIAMVTAGVVAISMAPEKLAPALLVGLIAQFLENNLLVPRVMDKSVGVNPIVTILSISAFGALFGFAGAVLAIPLAAMVQIIVQRLLRLRQGGTAVGRTRVDLLRLEARELAADVRKGITARPADDVTADIELLEDRLEAIATDLDSLLGTMEVEP